LPLVGLPDAYATTPLGPGLCGYRRLAEVPRATYCGYGFLVVLTFFLSVFCDVVCRCPGRVIRLRAVWGLWSL